ncbi:MAG: heme-binding protein [Acidobacteriia bacterium]|nr:heme-binding protein [Terriglobia bacterium]
MKNLTKIVLVAALKTLVGVGIAVLLCGRANAQGSGNAQGPANGQGLVTQRNLSLAMAKTIAEAALAACQAKGYHTTVAVVDRAGQVMVILRDEQATAQTVEMARRKAYTARMYRTTTLEFQKRTADPAYAAQRDVADILALGGGAPIQVGNETVGAVGSSGSSPEQDDACAKAGIAKVADLLK